MEVVFGELFDQGGDGGLVDCGGGILWRGGKGKSRGLNKAGGAFFLRNVFGIGGGEGPRCRIALRGGFFEHAAFHARGVIGFRADANTGAAGKRHDAGCHDQTNDAVFYDSKMGVMASRALR